MKHVFFTVIVLLISIFAIYGQDSLYVYKGGSTNSKFAISQIDSVTFNHSVDSLKLFKSGLVFNKLLIANIDSISFTAPLQKGTYRDIDGNIYTTVKIGNQTWMIENLKTTRFRNGDPIPNIVNGSEWVNTTTAAWCDYNNDELNGKYYGHLYNWFAANDSRILAPAGWHVPTVDEWNNLKNYLIANGYNYDGTLVNSKFAKSIASKTDWYVSNAAGAPGNNQASNNSTGFNAFPSGGRYGISSGQFFSLGIGSFWWTNTEFTDIEAWYKAIFYGYSFMGDYGDYKKYGYAIRCIKSDLASLTTSQVISISSSSALSGGNILSDGSDPILSRGLCWDTIQSPTISKNFTTDGMGIGTYTSSIKNLLPGMKYYARAYATNTVGTAYGNELVFTTLKTKPVLSTLDFTELTHSSVKTGGSILSNGGAQIISNGVCWSKIHNPVIENDSITTDTLKGNQFISLIKNLSPKSKYFVRAYARNSEGISYGNEIEITTLTTIPNLTTKSIESINTTSSKSGGIILSDGGDSITAKGVCWSVNQNPVIGSDSITVDGIGSEPFTSSITALKPGTTYFVRAYATNGKGTAYGNELSFKTNDTIPVLTTNSINSLTANSAKSGGLITSNGGNSITAKGVCWSVNINPVIGSDSTTIDGTGSEPFTSSITALKPGTTYFVRAYATNGKGTAYGNELSFKTNDTIPVLTTNSINSLTANSAKSGGLITSNGGNSITAKGVCWSVNINPVIGSDSTTIDGTGSEPFTSSITILKPGTTYFVRAYATNGKGTAYGNELSFKTNDTIPVVTTNVISNLTANSAKSGGLITSNGGNSITAKGVCWSTSPQPIITNNENKTNDGTGSEAFTSSVTALLPATTYYLRAYATNSAGTAYGNEVTFTTLTANP